MSAEAWPWGAAQGGGSSLTCRGCGQPNCSWLRGRRSSLSPGCCWLAGPAPSPSQAGEPSVSGALRTEAPRHQACTTPTASPARPAQAPARDSPVAALRLKLGLQQHLLHVSRAGGEPRGLGALWATPQLHPGACGGRQPSTSLAPALPQDHQHTLLWPRALLAHPAPPPGHRRSSERVYGPGHPAHPSAQGCSSARPAPLGPPSASALATVVLASPQPP